MATGGEAMDREGLEILGMDECLRLIARARVGRVAFMEAGEPLILPVNHALDRSNTIVFRSARGSKLDAAWGGHAVAFEVDGYDEASRIGWSVVVRGAADIVTDPRDYEHLESLGLRPWADAVPRVEWIRIRPTEISGRRILPRVI